MLKPHRLYKKSKTLTLYLAIPSFGIFSTMSAHAEDLLPKTDTGLVTTSASVPAEYSDTINTDTIVVTASGFAQQIKDAPASISVITQQQLLNKPFRDVTDALKDIPGVTITGGGGSSDISIRGMGSRYTLMLVDGKRQNSRETRPNSDAGGIEQGWIPPLSAIERIEVVRGPMSSLYGSDAMGGVINIITKKVAQEWGGNVRLESTQQSRSTAGSLNTIDMYLNGPLMQDTLGLQIYSKYSDRKEDRYIGGYPEQRIENISGKLTYTPNENHTIELEAGTALQKRLATEGKSREKGDSEHRSRRQNQSIRYQGLWGTTHSDLTVSHEKTNNYVRQMIIENINVNGTVVIPISTHTLTLGGQYRDEKLDDKGNQYDKTLTKLSRWNYALFVEDEWRIIDQFALTGGLRYDYDENYGKHWNPRLYGVWNLTDEFTLKGGVSTGFTAPALRQVVADWGQVTGGGRRDGVILGNPDLKPEKTTNYEISLNYANDNGVTASITGFHTVFKDKIQTFYDCNDTTNKGKCKSSNGTSFDFIQSRQNIDSATLQGIEISGKVPLPYDIALTTNYTWTKTEQTSGDAKGKPLNRIPDHQVNIGLDWKINEQFDVWAKANYNGRETEIDRSGNTTNKYPGYTLFDLGGSFKINKNNTMYAGVYNVSDKKVREENLGRVQDGRRYWLGLNIDF